MPVGEYGRPKRLKGGAEHGADLVFPFNRKLLHPPRVVVVTVTTDPDWGWDFDQFLVNQGSTDPVPGGPVQAQIIGEQTHVVR
jgi:hypothetical protein